MNSADVPRKANIFQNLSPSKASHFENILHILFIQFINNCV